MNYDQALDKELKENMLAVCELWKRRWSFVTPGFSTWFLEDFFKNSCITTSIVGCWKWWSKRPAYVSSGSALPLNVRLFLSFSFLVNVPKCRYVVFLGKYRLCANTVLIFTLRYGTIWIDWLRLPRNHLRRNLRGWIYSQRPLTQDATRHVIALRWCNI